MKKTMYDIVKVCLEQDERARDNDKFLHFMVYAKLGHVKNKTLTWEQYQSAPSFETIRRSRQKVQEEHPRLKAGENTQQVRDAREALQGDFINEPNNIF